MRLIRILLECLLVFNVYNKGWCPLHSFHRSLQHNVWYWGVHLYWMNVNAKVIFSLIFTALTFASGLCNCSLRTPYSFHLRDMGLLLYHYCGDESNTNHQTHCYFRFLRTMMKIMFGWWWCLAVSAIHDSRHQYYNDALMMSTCVSENADNLLNMKVYSHRKQALCCRRHCLDVSPNQCE